jgi:uncharacterized membrane protein
MAIPKTARMQEHLGKTAQVNHVALSAPITWLKKGISDFMTSPLLALFYGSLFSIVTYNLWTYLSSSQSLHDVRVPLVGVVVLLLGPISAMSLYDGSKRIESGKKPALTDVLLSAFKANGSCPSIFLSVMLIVLAIMWMMFSPLIYAIFNTGSLNIVSTDQTIVEAILSEITSGGNMGFLVAYFIFTAIMGLTAFMISWFSFPMVLDKDVDPFTATSTSLRAAMANKIIMFIWAPTVGVLVLLSLMTPYFIGLALVIPIIGHSTWHAYRDTIGELK